MSAFAKKDGMSVKWNNSQEKEHNLLILNVNDDTEWNSVFSYENWKDKTNK